MIGRLQQAILSGVYTRIEDNPSLAIVLGISLPASDKEPQDVLDLSPAIRPGEITLPVQVAIDEEKNEQSIGTHDDARMEDAKQGDVLNEAGVSARCVQLF